MKSEELYLNIINNLCDGVYFVDTDRNPLPYYLQTLIISASLIMIMGTILVIWF